MPPMAFSTRKNAPQYSEEGEPTPSPRICMPTARKFTSRAYQCGYFEAQDVLLETDDVDLICLEPERGFEAKAQWHRRLLFHDISKRLIFRNPGLRTVRLTRDYDLFVMMCPTYHDLLYLNAIENWKERCRTSVCWLDELWVAALPHYKYWLHALRQFDYVFVGFSGTAAPLSQAIDRPCRYLPGGVDALRFSPYPNPPARVIDVYSLGRRWDGSHQALLAASRREEIFYVYDTFRRIAESHVYDHRQHRDLYANLSKRSRYFVVAPGKMDVPEETQGQVEIGYRYYEGAAAGAVLIGQAPDSEAFRQLFPWPDVVMEIRPDGADVVQVLADLGSDPARASAIGRRNAAEAMLRHDWCCRWNEILRVAGMEPLPRMTERVQRLKHYAHLAGNDAAVEHKAVAGPYYEK